MPDLSRHTVAVLGGDKREIEIIRSFRAAGATVRTFGTIATQEHASLATASLAAALDGATVIVGPMPGVAVDGSLFAPHAEAPLRIDEDSLAAATPGAVFFSGRSTPAMKAAGAVHGVRFHDIGEDDYVQVQHAIPTAEAALALAITETDETLNSSEVLVVGYGRIGQVLAQYLRGLGAFVTVAARRPEVRARAVAMGHRAIDTTPGDLSRAIAAADIVYATAPATVLDRSVLERAEPSTLVIDLASPPGGLDHDAGKELGLRILWARAQADSAWRHSGRAQFDHMLAALAKEDGSA